MLDFLFSHLSGPGLVPVWSWSVLGLALVQVQMGPELLLDSSIRLWVVLPIVFITFLTGLLRHHLSSLLHRDPKASLQALADR